MPVLENEREVSINTSLEDDRKSFPGRRLLTAADLAMLPDELPSGPVRYELYDGELIIMSPAADDHGSIELSIGTFFKVHGDWTGHGSAGSGDVGILISRNPDTLVGADVAFWTNDQLPLSLTKEGYKATIPALVVEVVSKNDNKAEVARKVEKYLVAGVRVVLVAHQKPRSITVYRQGQDPLKLTGDDVLSLEDVIPGLAKPVRELFR